jgi:hypothetical protein
MDVVDDDERRVRGDGGQKRLRDRRDALGDERLLERCALGRRGQAEPEHEAE